MSTATLPTEFQDLPDGPGELTQADDGKVPVWSWEDRRLIMLPLPQPGEQRIIVRGGGGGGGGGTSTIAGATDFAGTLDASTDGQAIVWNNGTSQFVLAALATPGGSSTHIQYNNAGAFAGDSEFTYDGVGVVYVGAALGVGAAPSAKLYVKGNNEATAIAQVTGNTSNIRGVSFSPTVAGANGMAGFSVGPTLSPANNSSIIYGTINLATLGATASNVTNYYANFYRADIGTDYTGAITNLYTLFLQSPTLSSTSKPTSAYMVRVNNSGASGVTTSYAIDIAAQSGSATNYAIRTNTGLVEFGDALTLAASSTTRTSVRFRVGSDPAAPNDGDVWYKTSGRLTFYRSPNNETIASGITASGGSSTAGAAYTATEQTMLQKVYDAARAFGLLN